MTNTCNGCGLSFSTSRGLISHQSARFVTMACRPVRRYEIRKAYGTEDIAAGWDLFDRGEWANRFRTRADAADAVRELSRSI